MRRALILSLLSCVLGAQEFNLYREPDKKTRKEIENDLIASRGIGDGNFPSRRRSRERLIEIGGWSVPFLERAIAGSKASKNPLVRANAVFAATRIGDADVVDDLLVVLRKDKNGDVVRIATLSLGWFGADAKLRPAPAKEIRERLVDRSDAPAVILARAKLGISPAFDEGGKLPRGLDQHTASAFLLAAAITMKKPPLEAQLEHGKPIVRRAAAVGLRLRPDGIHETALRKAIRREKRSEIHALQLHALGAFVPRTKEAQAVLVKALTHSERDVQIAAAIELARGSGDAKSYKQILSAYRVARPAAAAAMMPALLASGDPKAIDELLKAKDKKRRHYVAGALLRRIAFGKSTERDLEIATTIARWPGLDPVLTALAQRLRAEKDPAKRRQAAVDALGSARGAPLWASDEERTWAIVDDLLLRIFQLDSQASFGNPDSVHRNPDTAITGDDAPIGRDSPTAVTPDEQDLADFLRPGYFRREDLRGR